MSTPVLSPIRRVVATATLVLLAPLTAACGFSAQTDQVYQPAVGTDNRTGTVDIINATIVSGQNGTGTFAGTLVNKDLKRADELLTVSGNGISATNTAIPVPAEGLVNLADSGKLSISGDPVIAGHFVKLTFDFKNGSSSTLNVPVVENTDIFSEVPLPTPVVEKSPAKSPSPAAGTSPTQTPSP